jgi:hypothetical protein
MLTIILLRSTDLRITKYGITLFYLIVLVGCANVPTPTMSGNWLLQLNSGDQFLVSINEVSPSNIFINADNIQLSGHYSLTNNYLTLIKANQPRISNIKFVGKYDGSWVMVDSPSATRTGYQLSGSSLTRIQQ